MEIMAGEYFWAAGCANLRRAGLHRYRKEALSYLCIKISSGYQQIERPKMTKKVKRAYVTKGRQSEREPVGMRAELEAFKRERILKEMIELF